MNDTEVRLRCVEAAVRVVGNPNTLQQAREFYAFATEVSEEAPTDGDFSDLVANITPTDTPLMKAVKKGSRK